jgi:3-oxoacid CoA-transferase subunit A
VRAKKCDEFGNLVFQGSERNFNPLMAMAARITVAEVEEIVPVGSIDPNQVHTPGIYVNRIVKIPADGIFFVPRVAPGTT